MAMVKGSSPCKGDGAGGGGLRTSGAGKSSYQRHFGASDVRIG